MRERWTWAAIIAGLAVVMAILSQLPAISQPKQAASKEEALVLALASAYPNYQPDRGQPLEVRWLDSALIPNSTHGQLVLAGTILPHDGFLSVFAARSPEGYLLLDVVTDMAHIDEVSEVQAIGDAAPELAVSQTLDQLVGAFFKITVHSIFKWSDTEKRLVQIWEYPTEIEAYDITTDLSTKVTKRAQLQMEPNRILVYETATTWQRDSPDGAYQALGTETKKMRYIWSAKDFTFVLDDTASN
ncbi:MAG: hypothetical protein GX030_00740 [Firmicutes bacterium]|nr:hypothetical protein [Bacillota bacterium]